MSASFDPVLHPRRTDGRFGHGSGRRPQPQANRPTAPMPPAPPAGISGDHASPLWQVRLAAARRINDVRALEWALDNEWDREVQHELYFHRLFKQLPKDVQNKPRDFARAEVDIDLMAERRDAAAGALGEMAALQISGGRYTPVVDGIELQCADGVRVRVRAVDGCFQIERVIVDGHGGEEVNGVLQVDEAEVARTARRAAAGPLVAKEES